MKPGVLLEMQTSPVFEQTYHHYVSQIGGLDYLSRAERLGVEVDGDCLVIPLYTTLYRVSRDGVEPVRGSSITAAVRVIICKYVLMCPDDTPATPDRLMTYREFRNAGPLVSYFTANTNKTIESQFAGKMDELKTRALRLGGVAESTATHDLSLRFHALPRIPVILNFNDSDDLFPASCSILYKQTAEHYLDMECLAMTGTLLAGTLIKP